MKTERSRKYYFDGPEKEFHTQNAAQRQAEWKMREMKEKYISAKILTGKTYYQVEIEYE